VFVWLCLEVYPPSVLDRPAAYAWALGPQEQHCAAVNASWGSCQVRAGHRVPLPLRQSLGWGSCLAKLTFLSTGFKYISGTSLGWGSF
jgi:hypothetical protein